MSSRLLELIADPCWNKIIEHKASDDLESLFYIFLKSVIIYGGPQGQWEGKGELPSKYHQWRDTYDQMSGHGLGASGAVKQSFLTDRSEDKVLYTVAKYFTACAPILQDWCKAIGEAIRDNHDISHKVIHKMLEWHLKDIENSQPPPSPIATSSTTAPIRRSMRTSNLTRRPC